MNGSLNFAAAIDGHYLEANPGQTSDSMSIWPNLDANQTAVFHHNDLRYLSWVVELTMNYVK
jgi:hypothetical protein